MPLYFFHLRDHTEQLIDDEGRLIEDVEGIAEAALEEARSILAHEVLAGRLDLSQRIEVEDVNGNVVHTLRFRDAVTIKT